MEEALENLKQNLDKRDDNLAVREDELAKGQRALKESQEKLAAEDSRLREWQKTLQESEGQISSIRDRAKADQHEVGTRLSEANSKLSGLIERETLIATREGTLGASLDRLSQRSWKAVASGTPPSGEDAQAA